jgi:hypothetical protein
VSDIVPPLPWVEHRPTKPLDRASHEANARLQGVLREAFVGRYTGAWLQADEFGGWALHVAVVDATSDDALVAESAAGQVPDATPVRLASSVCTYDEMLGFRATIRQWLDEHKVIAGVGLELRPDLSKNVVSVRSNLPDVAPALRALIPADAILIVSTDPTIEGHVLLSRDHIRP